MKVNANLVSSNCSLIAKYCSVVKEKLIKLRILMFQINLFIYKTLYTKGKFVF